VPISPWPVTFGEFVPHYEAAKKLHCTSDDSSHKAERHVSGDRALMEQTRQNGLTPDSLRVAMRYDKQCKEKEGASRRTRIGTTHQICYAARRDQPKPYHRGPFVTQPHAMGPIRIGNN
jgi:hypothetical protein